MLLNKNKILYHFILISFYTSIFFPILDGIIMKINSSYEMYVKIIVQSFIYILPAFIIFFVKLNTKRFFLVLILYLYLLSTQMFTEYTTISTFFVGYKTYFAMLLYIPIIHYLMKHDPEFDIKIEKHIKFIFMATLFILFFELFSRYIHNPVYDLFLSLASYQELAIKYSRPIGIGLDIHFQGIILASAIVYYFIHKKYLLSYVFFLALFLAAIKTWLVCILFISIIYIIRIKVVNLYKYFIVFLITICLIYFFFYAYIEHYMYQFSNSAYVLPLLRDLWFNSLNLMTASILPHGFISDADRYTKLPTEIVDYAQTPIFFLIYQIGVFGGILYVIILYYTIFKKSQYTPIMLLSLFAIAHTFYLGHIGIFIMIMYFGMYYIVENQRKNFLIQHKVE